MKKILLLGGSAQQIVAIETAKRLGYYTVVCDYLTDNPGQYVADKFYLASTTDRDMILKIAKEEKIDGILAYASDPAAPTAAYVAELMGLGTNSWESVNTLCNKDCFREFLREKGFNAPRANGYLYNTITRECLEEYKLPVIIKPVDSSGSKGVTVVNSSEEFDQAIEQAFNFSRTKRIIIEEFIEKKHKYLVGGDLLIIEGKVELWGMLNCHRDNSVNSLVPVGKSHPLILELEDTEKIKKTLQRLIDELGIKNGGMNIEIMVDINGKVWPIDIGPRSGGNMIPDLLNKIYNIDLVEVLIKLAMQEKVNLKSSSGGKCYATYNLHSKVNAVLQQINFSPEIQKNITETYIYKTKGDKIEFFDNASKALGIIFMEFDSQKEMLSVLDNMESYIQIS